jgi:hypothetical protein
MGKLPKPSGFQCYHCQSYATCKAGFARRKQRYFCHSCRRYSRANAFLPSNSSKRAATKNTPSASHLILQLVAIAQNLGRTPSTDDLRQLSKEGRAPALDVYYQVFGSYLAAVKKAGLPVRYNKEIDKDLLLAELRQLRRKLGRPLYGKDVVAARKRGEVSPLSQFQKAFLTIPRAIEAAQAGKKLCNREELISILRQLDKKLDHPVREKDLQELYSSGKGPSVKTFLKEFGSLRKARSAAKIKNVYDTGERASPFWRKYTSSELTRQLQGLGNKLGRKPTDRDLNRASRRGECASVGAFVTCFGSLNKAYENAGYQIRPRSYTIDEILEAVNKLSKKLGKMPGFNDLKEASKRGECPGPNTIFARIGNMSELKAKLESKYGRI